ncbi:unnamed protein product [Bursaphelenchus xylophilus]|uniref:(pine wood nematode) hypothetical protein n=1 Tax=Bursaphelenchus xylophilus TaxID=6326 RepID=A0A1I7S6I7_BURXY|nr:unnamed protein product [Bursaphelenchus xylophilus]CAG9120478.1 unnamed protein product [Bursaphelenchus xylophilus]
MQAIETIEDLSNIKAYELGSSGGVRMSGESNARRETAESRRAQVEEPAETSGTQRDGEGSTRSQHSVALVAEEGITALAARVWQEGLVVSKARVNGWKACELLFLLEVMHMQTERGRPGAQAVELSQVAGIRRGHQAIRKVYSELSRGAEKYSQIIIRYKAMAPLAWLDDPASFIINRSEQERGERNRESGAELVMDTSSEESGSSVNVSNTKCINKTTQNTGSTVIPARQNNVVNPDNYIMSSHPGNGDYTGVLVRVVDRVKLEKKRRLTNEEGGWIKKILTRCKLESIVYETDMRWLRANAALYSAIKVIAEPIGEPKLSDQEQHQRWLGNRLREELATRQKIGKCETCKALLRCNRDLSRKEWYLVRRGQGIMTKFPGMDLDGVIEHLKQRLSIIKEKVDVRRNENTRKQNRRAAGRYGHEIRKKQGGVVNIKDATSFWSRLAQADGKQVKGNSSVFSEWEAALAPQLNESPVDISLMAAKALKRAKPWKAPGPDGIYNFYWKLDGAKEWLLELASV